MARDLILGTSSRNWSRGMIPSDSGSDGTRKLVLGGMALTVLMGTAAITSPWWLPMPRRTASPQAPFTPPMRHRVIQRGPRRYAESLRSPSGRMIYEPLP